MAKSVRYSFKKTKGYLGGFCVPASCPECPCICAVRHRGRPPIATSLSNTRDNAAAIDVLRCWPNAFTDSIKDDYDKSNRRGVLNNRG